MIKIIKSQSGVSFVQVIMAAAMMGGLALVMSKMAQNQSKVQRSATNSMKINEMFNRVQKYMLNHDFCKETLSQAAISVTDGEVPINEIKTKIGGIVKTVLKVNESISQGSRLIVGAITVERTNSNTAIVRITIEPLTKQLPQNLCLVTLRPNRSILTKVRKK